MATPPDRPPTRPPRSRSSQRRRARLREDSRPPMHGPRGPAPDDAAPRIVEEHRIVGPYGEEEREVVDQYGRHFWSFRPHQPQRYDLFGYGWLWWLVLWIVIIGLIVWGWGWGWAY